MFIIIRWEISRLFSNWQRAAAVFVIPAAVMMVALTIFPYLINYMSTGSVSEKPIIIAGAPDSFVDYIEETEGTTVYKYDFMTLQEFGDFWNSGKAMSDLKKNGIFVIFHEDSIYVGCNGESAMARSRADSFIEVVMDKYNERLEQDGYSIFNVDSFNPVTKLLNYRTGANQGSARVIPAVLVLLIYYCVYSLMSDMFASERDRGFYDKLLMTPVSPVQIAMGKILSCTGLVTVASYTTFLFLFLASWLNRSNSASSLIPFGMMLLPGQLICLIIVIPVTAFFCAAVCFSIIFSVRRMKDVILNLQMTLIYLMAELFISIFMVYSPGRFEFLIPLHGSIAILKAVFISQYRPWQLILLLISTLAWSLGFINRTFKKERYIIDKRKRRT